MKHSNIANNNMAFTLGKSSQEDINKCFIFISLSLMQNFHKGQENVCLESCAFKFTCNIIYVNTYFFYVGIMFKYFVC